ncbi:MAG: FtsW/RodA/SpoVE family cell cycle protein, partial [Ellagibacter isourolithinifaciens]|uniref:FtsW/RodA/SpoVE family cell cycle protein n=1 Tax=Ellagibacter isourolithinifaciens TaxID=2137581 RepID=UPI0023EFA3D1
MALPQIDSLKTPDASLSRAASPRRGRLPLINLPFVAIIVLLVGYGLLVCWSSIEGSNDTTYSFTRQLIFAAVGAVVMMLMWRVDYQRFANAVMPLFIVNIALILSPHIPGLGTDAGMGAQSWLKLGIQVQPGEFAKITIILMDAALVARYGGRLDDLREYLKVVFFILVPFLAIMTQPDLGTGLVYLAIGAMALVAGGARSKYLLITLALGIAAIAAVFAIDQLIYNSTGEYKLLKQYQRNRLLVFLDQDGSNTSSSGYNLQQAKIAIGSGGLFGKGLLNATQSGHGFLPEAQTDFIFCVLAEQFGFVGSMA